MGAHVMCLTSVGGLPLFIRKTGEGDTLPFSVVASLNGVHMFSKNQEIDLLSSATAETTIVWKEMEESVIIIAAACGVSTEQLELLLMSVFQAMIMTVGIEEIKACRNIERLKRELRGCYLLVDRLLDSVDTTSRVDLIGHTEVILCQENHALQSVLEAHCECVGSLHGCLLVRGRVAAATGAWWALAPSERKLLVLLASGSGGGGGGGEAATATARDVPVFLPCRSPAVPFRLVVVALAAGAEVAALCGPAPALAEAEATAAQCWRGSLDLLRAALACCPRHLAPALQFDPGVMGVLLVESQLGKFMLSGNQMHSDGKKDIHRLDILCTFYYQGAGSLWKNAGTRKVLETYWCSEYHKCHALCQENTIICVLYASVVPTDTMRQITKLTLKILTTDKQICW